MNPTNRPPLSLTTGDRTIRFAQFELRHWRAIDQRIRNRRIDAAARYAGPVGAEWTPDEHLDFAAAAADRMVTAREILRYVAGNLLEVMGEAAREAGESISDEGIGELVNADPTLATRFMAGSEFLDRMRGPKAGEGEDRPDPSGTSAGHRGPPEGSPGLEPESEPSPVSTPAG